MALKKRIAAVLIGVLVSGCATDAGQKEQTGAVLGAIIGGILGGAATKDRHRAAGVVVGALAGGLLGGQIGRYFDEQDRRKIAEAADRALREGSAQTYVSPKTRAAVTMTPSQPILEPGRSIRALPTVFTASALRAESRQAYAATDLPAKATPSPSAEVTGSFARAEKLEIVAIVPDSSYRLVAKDGVAVGYVLDSDLVATLANVPPAPQTQLASVSSPDASRSSPKPGAKSVRKPPAKRAATKPALSEPASTPPPTPDSTTVAEAKPAQTVTAVAATPAEVKTVALAKECKVLTYDFVLPDGQRARGSQKSCYEPPAGWQAVTA